MDNKHLFAVVVYFTTFIVGDILARWFEITKNTFIIINFAIFPVVLVIVWFCLKEELLKEVFGREPYSFKASLRVIGKYFIIGFIGFVIIANIMPLFTTPTISDTIEVRRVQPLMIIPSYY